MCSNSMTVLKNMPSIHYMLRLKLLIIREKKKIQYEFPNNTKAMWSLQHCISTVERGSKGTTGCLCYVVHKPSIYCLVRIKLNHRTVKIMAWWQLVVKGYHAEPCWVLDNCRNEESRKITFKMCQHSVLAFYM